jgi:hypothetical protein
MVVGAGAAWAPPGTSDPKKTTPKMSQTARVDRERGIAGGARYCEIAPCHNGHEGGTGQPLAAPAHGVYQCVPQSQLLIVRRQAVPHRVERRLGAVLQA